VNKKAVSGIMLTLILIDVLTLIFNIQPVKSEPRTWIVDDDGPADFRTIQEAINSPQVIDGNTIFVRSGTYYEHVVVNKSITLIGEDKFNTRIYFGMDVVVNNVTVSKFRIFTPGHYADTLVITSSFNTISENVLDYNYYVAIRIYTSENNVITENIISVTSYTFAGGIVFEGNNQTIVANRISGDPRGGVGIQSYAGGEFNKIVGNRISNISVGINIQTSNDFVSMNDVIDCKIGIKIPGHNNLIKDNTIANCECGLLLYCTSGNVIYHNNFIGNIKQVCRNIKPEGLNVWDDGYLSGGNYWSDYNGTDLYSGPHQNVTGSDGIGDAPYVIDANNQDNYPLIHPYGSIRNLDTNLTYLTIQSAINAPETLNGHTIFVKAGIYYENVVVNKSIALIGESRNNTILDGNEVRAVIRLSNINNITIERLTIQNGNCGILLRSHVSNVSIRNCIIKDNWDGIDLYSTNHIIIERCIFQHNQHNSIWSSGPEYYITVRNNTISNTSYGIFLWNAFHSVIAYNFITNCTRIGIENRADCDIIGNIVSNCHGVEGRGIQIQEYHGNKVIGNLIENCDFGIWIYQAANTLIYHNSFINNTKQVENQTVYANVWDNGYPSGGNYWSDYAGVDLYTGPSQDLHGSDGIGDTPYIIDANNTDRYPLIFPFGTPPPPTYNLTIIATVGGTTHPPPGTYSYTENSTVEVTAIPDVGYLLYIWELNGITIGSTNPLSVCIDRDIVLTAVFLQAPPLSVSISPLSASILVGQSVTFTSTVSGGISPYNYQWYLNGSIVLGATSETWIVTPSTAGIYEIYLNVTDSSGNVAISATATISVAPQIIVSISPMSMAVVVGEPITFTSTTTGGYPPYSYQWYLNGNPISGATPDTWTFAPTASGIYYVYLKVTDDKGNTAQSDTAHITVAALPVGGYSIPIETHVTKQPLILYLSLMVTLTVSFTIIKRRKRRKLKQT